MNVKPKTIWKFRRTARRAAGAERGRVTEGDQA